MANHVVNLSDYNPDWALQFEDEKKIINKAIGKKLIEHIGSTSIKGLESTPIIDIMAGVNDFNEVKSFVNPLRKIGFE